MKRAAVILSIALALGGSLTACQRTVEVETGVRVDCTYGHVISDDVTVARVPAGEASAYRVRTETRVCDRHLALEKLYDEAQAAIEAGDLAAASEKLAAILKDDPEFRRAREQADAIAGGKKPDSDRSGGSGGSSVAPPPKPKPGDGDTSGPVGSLARWVPDSIPGFTAKRPGTDAFVISRDYVPSGDSQAVLLVIQAEQHRSASDAKRALGGVTGSLAAGTAKKVTINGHEVTVGHDGRGSSFAVFTDGAVLVALEMAAKRGVDPGKLSGSVQSVVKVLP